MYVGAKNTKCLPDGVNRLKDQREIPNFMVHLSPLLNTIANY